MISRSGRVRRAIRITMFLNILLASRRSIVFFPFDYQASYRWRLTMRWCIGFEMSNRNSRGPRGGPDHFLKTPDIITEFHAAFRQVPHSPWNEFASAASSSSNSMAISRMPGVLAAPHKKRVGVEYHPVQLPGQIRSVRLPESLSARPKGRYPKRACRISRTFSRCPRRVHVASLVTACDCSIRRRANARNTKREGGGE